MPKYEALPPVRVGEIEKKAVEVPKKSSRTFRQAWDWVQRKHPGWRMRCKAAAELEPPLAQRSPLIWGEGEER